MIIFSLVIATLSIFLTWLALSRRYKTLLKQTIVEAQHELSQENERLAASLKDVTQKNADLEYLLREKEKDLNALRNRPS